ncbi:MAG: bifunctional riboflavin kinase/FAD synthetase [Dehalococcoidia bacterium]|nr:MAG: bifunctional riboflavin kinase/FAD synthetase [Dehalococcoidia bacterium]
MQIEEELAKVKPQKETLLTIGVFDGVHLGHQHLLTHLRNEAREKGWLSGVVTFKSHPQAVLSHENKLFWLNDLETRISLLRGVGIDVIVVLSFTLELAQLTAREFVQLLKDYLQMRGLVIGPDFALGRNREGDAAQLRLLGQEMGFSVEVVPPLVLDGEVVSSSAVRQTLAQGNMEKVEKLSGRFFSLSGRVVSGDKRGRVLGFPTANLDVKPEQALPGDGVYVTVAYINHEALPSVTNIGIRPTFGGGERVIETYLLDYEGQVPEQKLRIDLVSRLRDERRFGTAEELKAQIRRDIDQARIILDKRARQEGTDFKK